MNEITLLWLCCLVAPISVMPIRKRMSKGRFLLLALTAPIVLYAFLIIAFAMLALLSWASDFLPTRRW